MRNYKPATFQPTIRQDWAGILNYISDKEKAEILTAIFKYPTIECNSSFWKETIKPDLDLQYETFKSSCEAKSRGVRNRWGKISITDVEDMYKICNTDVIDAKSKSKNKNIYLNNNINNNNINNINNNTQEKQNLKIGKEKKFIPPTLQEVLDYAKEQNNFAGLGGFRCSRQMAESFWSNYEANGWIVSNESRTPIKDWKAKLRQWAIKDSFNSEKNDDIIQPKQAIGDK